MKTKNVFQLISIFVLAGCRIIDLNSPRQTLLPEPSSSVLLTPSPAPVPFITATLPSPYVVIAEENISQLTLIKQWGVESISQRGVILWFSDSNQFIVPTSNGLVDGIQSFEVGSSIPTWFAKTDSFVATIDTNNQVVFYLQGLHILNKNGVEIQIVETTNNCDENTASHLVAVPGTDMIVSGHQTALSDFGLNYNIDDKSRLLIWDPDKGSCTELQKEFTGQLWSLSASEDGRYVSYNFGLKDLTTGLWQSVVKVYDLILQKEVCSLAGLNAQFNHQNQLAIYDPQDATISLATSTDCTSQTKFKIDIEPLVLSFHPNGDMLAIASKDVVSIWSLEAGKKIHEINLHTSSSNLPRISFSPDGRYLVIVKFKEIPTGKDDVMLWGILAN